MLDHVYSTPKALGRARRSWLKAHIDRFLSNRADQGYVRGSLWLYANRLLRFGEFLEQRGIREMVHLPQWVKPFLARHYPLEPDKGICRSTLARFLDQLIQEGVISDSARSDPAMPYAELVEDYVSFLRVQRGLCHEYLQDIRRRCAALLAQISTSESADLKTVRPEAIHRFLVAEGKRCGRTTLSQTCSILRGFLAFLKRRGVMTTDLSSVVVAPRVYQHERCPRFLTPAEIEKVLSVIDRQSSLGRRDYAMLLLLSVYGLRGIEVVRLQFDDLDWRTQRLHVRRRKAGNHTTYPLAVSVGEAIVEYLRLGRPTSTRREVFLASVAPFVPLTCDTLSHYARKYIAQAGVQVERPGTHTFRYSCAQQLIAEGMSLKVIGDYLGHMDPNSTQRYTKIAVDQLREVAMGDGEDLL